MKCVECIQQVWIILKYAHAHDMKVQNLFFSSTLTYIRKLAHITQPAAYPQHSIANQAQVAVTHESLV